MYSPSSREWQPILGDTGTYRCTVCGSDHNMLQQEWYNSLPEDHRHFPSFSRTNRVTTSCTFILLTEMRFRETPPWFVMITILYPCSSNSRSLAGTETYLSWISSKCEVKELCSKWISFKYLIRVSSKSNIAIFWEVIGFSGELNTYNFDFSLTISFHTLTCLTAVKTHTWQTLLSFCTQENLLTNG